MKAAKWTLLAVLLLFSARGLAFAQGYTGFIIPNATSAPYQTQANVFSQDFQTITDAARGNGVLNGCQVTTSPTPGMTVQVTSGAIQWQQQRIAVTPTTLTVPQADSINPRVDIVSISRAGVPVYTAGVAAMPPTVLVPPVIPFVSDGGLGINNIVIAFIYVPARTLVIASTQITDKRMFVLQNVPGAPLAAPFVLQAPFAGVPNARVLSPGAGIVLTDTGPGGTLQIDNSGVTGITAGTNIVISGSTGNVTISATGGAAGVTGSGTTGTLPVWTNGVASVIGDSTLRNDANGNLYAPDSVLASSPINTIIGPGLNNTSTGSRSSLVGGEGSQDSGEDNVTWGDGVVNTGTLGTACFGSGTTCAGQFSFAANNGSTAAGDNSVALIGGTSSAGSLSVSCNDTGTGSTICMGNNTVAGTSGSDTVLGFSNSLTDSSSSGAIGFNITFVAGGSSSWAFGDAINVAGGDNQFVGETLDDGGFSNVVLLGQRITATKSDAVYVGGTARDLVFPGLATGGAPLLLQVGSDGTVTSTSLGVGTVTHTGALTANLPVVGNGVDDIKVVSLLPNVVGGTGVDSSGFTGLALVTAGVWSAYAGTTPCAAGDFISALSASGVATCTTPAGGGNVNAGATLVLNEIVLGAGSTSVATLGSLGTTTTVLHGNAAGAPSFAAVSLSADVTGSLALTSIASIASPSMLGNVTGSSAPPSAITLTSMIDAEIGRTQGSILYRGAAAWQVLVPGVSGRVLQTQGASADPIWAATGGGTVTTTGSPVSGNLAKFSGATSITSGDLSGDVTTSGTLVTALALTGVSAGTYGQVAVDTKGRVTAGTVIADVTHGGTGIGSVPIGALVYGNSLSPMGTVSPGGANTVLHGATPPSYSRVSLGSGSNTSGDIIGNLPVGNLDNGSNADASHFWAGSGHWLVPPGVGGTGAPGLGAIWTATATLSSTPSIIYMDGVAGWNGTATQNRTALATALAALPASGGTIVIPAGTFQVDCANQGSPLIKTAFLTTKPVIIRGAGSKGTTILQIVNGGISCADSQIITAQNASGVVIKDLQLDAAITKTGGAGILLKNSQSSLIDNVITTNQYVGVYWSDVTASVMRASAHFSYLQEAMLIDAPTCMDGGDNTIETSTFNSGALSPPASIEWLSSGGLRVINNKFVANGSALVGTHIDLNLSSGYITGSCQATGDILIANNSIEKYSAFGIRVRSSPQTPTPPGPPVTASLTNLNIDNNQFGVVGSGSKPISLEGGVVGPASIADNIMPAIGAGSVGISVTGPVDAYAVSGNTVSGDAMNTTCIALGASVLSGTVSGNHCVSTPNQITSSTNFAVITQNGGNTFTTAAQLAAMSAATGSQVACGNCTLTQNMSGCAASGGVTGTTAVRMSGAWRCM